jgi:hypothetical protein
LPFTKKEHYKNIMIRPLHPECFQILHEQAIKLGMLEENLVTFGTDAIDSRIKGGLAQRALHEVFAASVEDGSSAAAFAIMIGMRACPAHRPIIWVREHRCGRHMGHIGLVTVLCRSPERLEFAKGDRRDDQAFRRV